MDVRVVVIDNQNDFCDPKGALYVPGADKDAERCAAMIRRLGKKIDGIHATLDSHSLIHIPHPIWWMDSNGNHPQPFTIITVEDVEDGRWMTYKSFLKKRSLDYLKALRDGGKYPHCIWPPHCLIGSWGHNIYPPLFDALLEWEGYFKKVDYRVKGSNPFTEHFSALEAEVPDPSDPTTMLDTKPGSLIDLLANSNIVALTGQALSHCLANTVRSIVNNFGEENIKKLYLIEDCTSSVPGFEHLGDDFVNEMVSRGMNVTTSTEFLS